MDQLKLILRVAVLYPLAGLLAGYFGFVTFDEAAGQLIIDVNAAGGILAAVIWSIGAGGTFFWSRVEKAKGGAV